MSKGGPFVFHHDRGGCRYSIASDKPELVWCNASIIFEGDRVAGYGWTIAQVRDAEHVRLLFREEVRRQQERETKPHVWLPVDCEWKLIDGKWFAHREHEDESSDDTWGPIPETDEIEIYRALIEARQFLDARAAGLPYPGAPRSRKAWTLPELPRDYSVLAKPPHGVVLRYQHNEQPEREIWITSCAELLAMMHLIEAYNRERPDDWQFISSGSFDLSKLEQQRNVAQ